MRVSHLLAFFVHLFHGEGERAGGAAPTHHEEVGIGIAGHFLVGNVVGHAVHLLLTVVYHQGVVLGIGAQRSVGTFLQTAHAVTETLHAGQCPFASVGFGIATERSVVGVVRRGKTRFDVRHVRHLGDAEQLGTVAEVAVGEQDDGSHVLQGNLGGIISPVETVGAGRSSHDYQGSLAVTAVQSLVQVALLGLGRKTRGRTAALDVNDDERQFHHHSQTESFTLQGETGTRGGGASQSASVGCADGGANACDFVFSLEDAST